MPIPAWAWIAPAEFLSMEHRNDLPRVLLAKLNYWERAYGTSSIPPGDRGRMASTGEERAAMARYIEELRDKDIHVALDADEGLWKVSDDGANGFLGTGPFLLQWQKLPAQERGGDSPVFGGFIPD